MCYYFRKENVECIKLLNVWQVPFDALLKNDYMNVILSLNRKSCPLLHVLHVFKHE